VLKKETLQQIINNSTSSDVERREAEVALRELEPGSQPTEAEERAVSLCGPLSLDLLRFSGAHELRDVGWQNLVQFTDFLNCPGGLQNHDVELLWLGWIVWGSGGISSVEGFREHIWTDIKKEFATDQERRAEFERIDREYPIFSLCAIDNPHELEMYARHLDCSDRNSILAIARKTLDQAPEYWFRTREVAQRIIEKLTERK
jgi:hypothetical protein